MKKIKVAFTALSFTLLASPLAWSQNADVAAAQSEVMNTKAVSVSEGMAPSAAPAAPVAAAPVAAAPSVSSSATGSGINNSTTVNVTAASGADADAASDAMSNNGRTNLLKKDRYRRESDNESRLVEKLEQARLEDEAARAEDIEKFKTGVKNQPVNAAPVQPAAPVQAAPVAEATATAVVAPVIVTTVNEKDEDESVESAFRISPFVGYRWINGKYETQVRNRIVTGLALEGAINDYLSVEGSFSFAQDEFRTNGSAVAVSQYNYGPQNYSGSYNRYIRTRNTFGVMGGGKLGLPLGRFRPYAAAGFGGRFSKYEIDDSYTKAIAQAAGWQRSTNALVANGGLGVDFKVAQNFGVGTRFDYEATLNKRNNAMNRIYGDSANSMRLTASAQVLF